MLSCRVDWILSKITPVNPWRCEVKSSVHGIVELLCLDKSFLVLYHIPTSILHKDLRTNFPKSKTHVEFKGHKNMFSEVSLGDFCSMMRKAWKQFLEGIMSSMLGSGFYLLLRSLSVELICFAVKSTNTPPCFFFLGFSLTVHFRPIPQLDRSQLCKFMSA